MDINIQHFKRVPLILLDKDLGWDEGKPLTTLVSSVVLLNDFLCVKAPQQP